MVLFIDIFGAACTGAALQEVVYWYGQREKPSSNYRKQNLKNTKASPEKIIEKENWTAYWIITICMIIGSGLGTYYWYADRLDVTQLRDVLITGAAFPTLLKTSVQSYIKSGSSATRMGSKTKSGFMTYFGGRR